MKTKKPANRFVRFNPIASATIMRKGGVHEKSKSAKRFTNKQLLKKETDDVV